jgi:hypothetical protein
MMKAIDRSELSGSLGLARPQENVVNAELVMISKFIKMQQTRKFETCLLNWQFSLLPACDSCSGCQRLTRISCILHSPVYSLFSASSSLSLDVSVLLCIRDVIDSNPSPTKRSAPK